MSAGWPDARRSAPAHNGNPAAGGRPNRGAKAIIAALVLVVLIVFVIRNSQRVSVDFILIQGHFRLIWVIAICSILGGIVGYLLGRPQKGSKGKRQRSSADPAA